MTNFTHVFFTILGSYVAMENEASVRCILDILNIKMWNECRISRQTGIQEKKFMRKDEKFQDVLHQFDPWHALRKKCVLGVILVYIFPTFSHIWTGYGQILCISSYSVQMQEITGKMQTRIFPNTDTFYALMLEKVY